jgi:hypothetical protein
VQDTIHQDAVLIRDNAILPGSVRLESELYLEGWRLVKNFDGNGLARALQPTGWTFFWLAGEIKATGFGFDEESMVRRAIKRIVASPRSKDFNSLEITRIALKHSLGLPCVIVGAQLRHIQESLFLFSPGDVRGPGRGRSTATREEAWASASAKGLAIEGTNGRASVAAARIP